MNSEQAFLQAIRESPHDDAPRLIYADWLEEQGGADRAARAAFIRAQCHLAGLPEDHPQRSALEDEATDLLAEHESEWTQPLHDLAEDWRFERGFVEHLRIHSDNFLPHAERLCALTPLRSLHLRIPSRDVAHLADCSSLQWIESLDFSRCHLNDRALQQLLISPHLRRLTALHLHGNSINTPGMQALVQSSLFARLHALDLSRNLGIGGTAVRTLAQANPANHLEVLNLASTNLPLNGLYELLQSQNLPRLRNLNVAKVAQRWGDQAFQSSNLAECAIPPRLRALDVSELPLPRVNLRPLLAALSAENLRALYLGSCFDEYTEVEMLARLPGLAKLTSLNLPRNNLGSAGVLALADSPHLAALTHLNLSHNNIRDTGARSLAASPYLASLLDLDISGNGIGGPGLSALAQSSSLASLRRLNLASNFIGTDSVRALAESEHLRNLGWLDLSDAFLEEDSARALASSANLAPLRTLLLKKNLLGDGGARALSQSPSLARLTTLDLNDNRVGKAGAEALAAASWRRMRNLDVRGNIFTDTQEALLRQRFGEAVRL